MAATADTEPERVKLIAITWIPANAGLVNPAVAVDRVAQAHGIAYLLDACQAVGQMLVDVEELAFDMLSAIGRKFLRWPRGTGFLYVRKALLKQLEPQMLDHFAAPWEARDRYALPDDARRFQTWENNCAAQLGLGVAVDYALALGPAPSAIVSFTMAGHAAVEVVASAARADLTIGASQASSTRLDAEIRGLPPLVRASPHYCNSESDVDRLIAHCVRLAAT